MSQAWASNLPSGPKMILLALADHANDVGECFPSVEMLAGKCSMSERTVFNHLSYLEKIGAYSKQNRRGRSSIYKLDPCRFCTPANSAPLQILHPTPANSAPAPLQILHPTPANSAPITIINHQLEPSSNHQLLPKKRKQKVLNLEKPDDVSLETWTDFVAHRSNKKALISPTVIREFRKQSELAGLTLDAAMIVVISRNWQGFDAQWYANLQPQTRQGAPQYQSADERRAALAKEHQRQNFEDMMR